MPGPQPHDQPLLVHGLGRELVLPDWPPLTDEEVQAVLAQQFGPDARSARVLWRSPRPLSAAGLVEVQQRAVFVKRHHARARSVAQLAVEHALSSHLREREVAVPAVLGPALELGGYVYELHSQATGLDLYREDTSWSPFRSLGHARTAGAALARFHRAAEDFPLPERPFGPLMGSAAIVRSPRPLGALAALVEQRPTLASALRPYDWQQDFARHIAPAAELAAAALAPLRPNWAHCDWHPTNLTWASDRPDADVAEVIDLGLANLTFAVHDLATAIERSAISWLDLAEIGSATADLDALDALLDGYETLRPLSPGEASALALVLPVVHVEYALSEVEYYADIVGSRANADLAYHAYLLGHARWFEGPEGLALLQHLEQRARR
ncbi:MAG: phosphotransferase enzyme family protein [Acidimicrobiales bacterium]